MTHRCKTNADSTLEKNLTPIFFTSYKQCYKTSIHMHNYMRTLDGVCVRLVTLRNKDSRRYNTPTTNKVGAIMVRDGTDTEEKTRDIIVKKNGGPLQRISILDPSYLAMHYVLLFPDGRDAWHPNIPLTGFTYDNVVGGFMENPYENIQGQHGRGGSKRVSVSQFHTYTLHPRHDEHIFQAGRLLQQFIVDGYACAEGNRLHFLRQHQSNLRVDIYKGAQDAMYHGDTDASQIGQKLILMSSFTGGPRQMRQLYQDAMGIVRNCGKPDIFLTFTCKYKMGRNNSIPSSKTSSQ